MLNLVPQPQPETPYSEAVSRLASVRHALRLVDGGFADGAEGDQDEVIAAAWPKAGEAKQRRFDRRSAELVGSAAAGIEALLAQRHDGREPHRAASEFLVREIRRELEQIAGIVLA